MSELDRIKLKIKALTAKTVANGCSEHEAMSAMEGVGRLLAQYNLTMEECDVRTSPCKTIFLDINRVHRHPIDSCIAPLADLVGARCWFHRRWGPAGRLPSAYAFFGQESDLELIDYLFRVIRAAIDHESEEFKQDETYREMEDTGAPLAGKRRTATLSFQRGMAARIATRLRDLKQTNEAELAKVRPTGTALVVLKKQLIADEFEKTGTTLKSVRVSSRVGNLDAFARGTLAGDRVNLSRPIPGRGKVGGLIGG